jgi:methyl-accepting chemotaxis protein
VKLTIKVQIICIFATMLALLGAIIVAMGLNSAAQERVADAQLNLFQSNKLADQLRQSSDDLTRMARTYAVTGDATYEQYFFDILAIRDGTAPRPLEYHEIYWDFVTSSGERPTSSGRPAALMDLMEQIGLSGEELAKLKEAKKNSDDLTKLEMEAFGAMKGLFADDLGNLTVRREPDPEFAREILHSSEYHKAKAEIMRPIGEFMKLIDERMQRELEAVQTQEVFFSTMASVLTVATLLFSIFAFFHVKRRAVDPVVSLAAIAQRIEHGHSDERATITISSSDELGVLYRAFNRSGAWTGSATCCSKITAISSTTRDGTISDEYGDLARKWRS